jgi:hypothetical protein
VIIIGAFFLLGGGTWMTGMMHRGGSIGTIHLNWVQILISMELDFIFGSVASKQRWISLVHKFSGRNELVSIKIYELTYEFGYCGTLCRKIVLHSMNLIFWKVT